MLVPAASSLRRPPSESARTLAGRFSLVMTARLAGAGVGFASQLVLARVLGAEPLGRLYVALSLAGVMATVCSLGFPSVTARFVAQYRTARDWSALAAFISVSRRYSLIAACAVSGLAAVGVALAPWLARESRDALLLGLLTTPAFTAMNLNGATANAHRRFGLVYVPELLGRPILLLVAGALVTTVLAARTATVVLLLHLIGCLGLVIAQRRMLRGLLPAERDTPRMRDRRAAGRRWLEHATPMIVVALFTQLFADLEILLVSPLLAPEQVGVFAVCLRLALMTGFAVQLVQQLILPDTAEAYSRGDTQSVRAHILRANLLSTSICLAAAVVIAAAGRPILTLFGKGFVDGYACLVVLAISQVLRAAAGPAAHVLTFAGAERTTIAACAVSLVILAASNAILASTFGLVGAAAAVTITTVLWNTWLASLARRRAGVETTLLRLVA
jgi:O-antigen/teichoic acid export membrane protein